MQLGFVTGARSDWTLIEPLLRSARRSGSDTFLAVTGTHLSAAHGETVREIELGGWRVDARVPILEDTTTAAASARATGRAVVGFSDVLAKSAVEWVILAGDRYETFAAGLAATMLGLPVAHIAGGETDIATNQDGNLRNALSKLAHLHFVAHDLARERVLALGEEPWRVHVSGLPSLDGIADDLPARRMLEQGRFIAAGEPFVLVNYLPVTLRAAESLAQLGLLLEALEHVRMHKLFVLSNADAGGSSHDQLIRDWSASRGDCCVVETLAAPMYRAALRDCAVFCGNSSSGVIESPVFGTPVVDIGARQAGRPAATNVIRLAEPDASEIVAAIRQQIAHGPFAGVTSPYGDGNAAPLIIETITWSRIDARLLNKRLELPGSSPEESHKNAAKRPRIATPPNPVAELIS